MIERKYKGYLARNLEGDLWFHQKKPHKVAGLWINPKQQYYIPRDYFSEVQKETPVEVEITVKLKL